MLRLTLPKTRAIRFTVSPGLLARFHVSCNVYNQQNPPNTKLELQTDNVPWYIRQLEIISNIQRSPIPDIPKGAPESLSTFLNLMSHDYGLEDIGLYDLSVLELDHPNSIHNQPADYMLIATAKSERHVYKAGQELKHYIKHNMNHLPKVSGLVSWTQSPLMNRRLKKRANKSPPSTHNEYGKPANSWIMCETLVDNIFIHILTKERRQELDLESLWVNEETPNLSIKYNQLNISQTRGLHVSRLVNNHLSTTYNKILKETVADLDSAKITKYIDEFESKFSHPSIEHYNLKARFFMILHTINPQIVDLNKVSRVLLEKYNDLALASKIDISNQRSLDLMKFMTLVTDSPELSMKCNHNQKQISDESLDLLSKFAMQLYRFTGDDIDLETEANLIPLLINLTQGATTENGIYLGPAIIDDTIHHDTDHYQTSFVEMTQASNRTRDVLDMITYYLEQRSEASALSRSCKELILFMYGNCGKWDKFWSYWDTSMNFLEPKRDSSKWVRLIVYLALRNDTIAIKRFFDDYWVNSKAMAGSFLSQYNSSHHELTHQENYQLKKALTKLSETYLLPPEVRAFINTL